MALPTPADLLSLAYADRGTPFVRLATTPDPQADRATPFAVLNAGSAGVSASSTETLPSLTGQGADPVTTVRSDQTLPVYGGAGTTPAPAANRTSNQTRILYTGTGDASQSPALPLFEAVGTATAGAVGRSEASLADDLAQVLPVLAGTGAGGPPRPYPALAGSGRALVGAVGASVDTLPARAAQGHAAPGSLGRSTLAYPALAGRGGLGRLSELDLPSLTGEAHGLSGVLGTSTVAYPARGAQGHGATPAVGASDLVLPPLAGTGRAAPGALGASVATLSRLLLAGEGLTGVVGQSDLVLPILHTTGAGAVQAVGFSRVTLPALIALAPGAPVEGDTAAPAATPGLDGFALQTQITALTTYSPFAVEGLARFNGVYLAAGPGGLFVLEGGADDTALIAAAMRLAVTDFGDPHIKRVEGLYVDYRADGDLVLKVTVDDTTAVEYPLSPRGGKALNSTRAKFGRGLKGVYWQFELRNVNGADFALDHLDPVVLPLSRRLG